MPMGYARVSPPDRDPEFQVREPKTPAAKKSLPKKYPEPGRIGRSRRKLFRLVRSPSRIMSAANDLRERGIEPKVIARKIEAGAPERRLFFHMKRSEYKLLRRGGKLLLIPPQYTGRKCLSCGYVTKAKRNSNDIFPFYRYFYHSRTL
jgi:predicted Zn-ribbon and HTH transcriptional regulator